jgi:hypothetical protein
LHPLEIVIVDNEMKRTLDYSKLIEICDDETDDGDTDETYQIVVTPNEGKTKHKNLTRTSNYLMTALISRSKTVNQDDFNGIEFV